MIDPPPGPLVRAMARLASDLLPLPGTRPQVSEIKQVLVVRTDDRVGNALLTIPLVRALQKAMPAARVDLLLAGSRAAVAEGLPKLSIVRFDKQDSFLHPYRFVEFLRRLRAAGYDVVIDAAHWHSFSLTSALLSRWAARRWLIGHNRGGIYSETVPLPGPGTAEIAAKVALGAPLGVTGPLPPMETSLGRRPSPVEGRFAAMNPGARKSDHRWPAAHFGALARALRDRFRLPSVMFWGPGEESIAREAVAASSGAARMAPATDLDELAAALRASILAVTNDTGPMHLAVACRTPVVALFLDEEGLRWAHPGPAFAAVVAPAGIERVVAAAAHLLDTARPAAEPPVS
jgi:ADP-heptose:LPS heptosyltransferase